MTRTWFAPEPAPAGNPEGTRLRRGQSLALTLAVSSVIALLLSLLQGYALTEQLLISNSIGLWIWSIAETIHRLSGGRFKQLVLWLVAVPCGIALGAKTAALLGAFDLLGKWSQRPATEWKSISVTFLFAASAVAVFTAVSNAMGYRMKLELERGRSHRPWRAYPPHAHGPTGHGSIVVPPLHGATAGPTRTIVR